MSALYRFGRNLNLQPAPAPRRPLADLTNTQPLVFGSPIKRSLSDPIPGTRLPAVIAPQSPLSPLGRAAVVTLAADKQPTKVVALKLDTSERTVRRWKRKFEEQQSLEDEKRSGRPFALDEETMINIAVTARVEKFVTPRMIKAKLHLADVSPRTIRRVLDAAGLHGRISRISPPLTEVHQRKRLAFANGYRTWDEAKWRTVLWSDEASALCGTYGQVWVQREVGTAWDPQNVTHRIKHPPKVHMWGCFSGFGMGDLFLFEENLDAPLMLKILKQHLLQSARRLFPPGQWWFQQDNDPKHTSRIVQDWIQTNGIDVLDWPPYSPDLNPIENLWADVKRRAEVDNPKNVAELKIALRSAWKATDPRLIKSLVASMHKRCQLVRDKAGWMTGY